MGTKMKKLFLIAAVLFSTSAFAGNYNIDTCNDCTINVQKRVVKKVVRPVVLPTIPVAVAPAPVVVGAVPAGPGPISSVIPVPVYARPPVCGYYPDPYTFLGDIFGYDIVYGCY